MQLEGSRAAIQVFEGTNGLSLTNTRTRFKGKPMELPLSLELLGRVFNGSGRPIDGLGEIYAEKSADINGLPLNPVSRVYPRNYINTGISSIDALMTLIRGQKLPIFSGSGMPTTNWRYSWSSRQRSPMGTARISVSSSPRWASRMMSLIIFAVPLRKPASWNMSSCSLTCPTTRSSSVR